MPVDIFGGDTLADDYAQVNPARRVPVLEPEPDRFIPESGAILLYLAEGSELLPDDPIERAQVHRWLFFEQTQIYPTAGGLRFLVGTGRIDAENAPKGLSVRALKVLDEHLGENDFLVGGRYTLADLALYGYTHCRGRGRPGDGPLSRDPAMAGAGAGAARPHERSRGIPREREGRRLPLDLRLTKRHQERPDQDSNLGPTP